MRPIRFLGIALLSLSTSALWAEGTTLSQKEINFFETKIRPVLSENCYRCHSEGSEKIKGSLLLDSREGIRKGGETGPAIVPRDLKKSLLITAIHYTDKDLRMPPNDKKLTDEQIADFETWVKMGAPDPREKGVGKEHSYSIDWDKARKHWAFQPITKPSVPQVPDSKNWAKTPVDQFILEKLLLNNLSPSAKADKVTLIRRATFDLIGLPPTSKEVENFLADNSAKAFEKVIDRLLASPHYGERWARYWLDLSQYGDTKGTTGNGRDPRYIYAYSYRDWVIKAFNDDMPYDKFLIDQIAADKLPNADKQSLAAMGFLTLGQRFNNSLNDIIDNRITILCQGTLGLTANCARCHDHKFDPIPTRDYYSLYGIFASSSEPKEPPLIEEPKNTPAYRDFAKQLAARQGAFDEIKGQIVRDLADELSGKAGEYMMALVDFKKNPGDLSRTAFMQKRDLNSGWAGQWDNNLRYWEKRKDPVFSAWFEFSKLDEANFKVEAKALAGTIYNSKNPKRYNPSVAKLFFDAPESLTQVASRYSTLFLRINKEWQAVLASYEAQKRNASTPPDEPDGLQNEADEQVRDLMYAANSPLNPDDQKVNFTLARTPKLRSKLNELDRAVIDLKSSHPGSPARAFVLQDAAKPVNAYVFIKGNPGNRGPQVPRQFFEILSGTDRKPFTDGSGRLELAKAIASPENPLTARVMVNRIWLHHFGEGIVRTSDDFGLRSDPPSHPELLDYLASTFIENGWSIKKLHKLIMLSSVYQQGSDEDAKQQQIDPDNHWLWRMNRRRLDFEGLRDTILAIGGKLDLTMGGPSVKLDSEPYSLRRSIYGYVDRNNLPNMLTAFDFASPDLTTGQRETTVVPQQALFMMNSSLVVEQARDLAQRPDFRSQATAESKVKQLYKVIYQREPSEYELNLALAYLKEEWSNLIPSTPEAAWSYGYGEFDAYTKKVKLFVPMSAFRGNAWDPDPTSRDPKANGARLSADGGSPGKEYAVIRRWTAPRDGAISIDGIVAHRPKEGDGIMCRVVSSRSGELGKWVAFKTQFPVKLQNLIVKQGDTIDFVVDGRKDSQKDYFSWVPTIKMTVVNPKPNEILEWNAKKDFSGKVEMKRMVPWEKFAQVLLETNELTFVN